MSEYQYYEFRAVDRPLSQSDRAELRRISSRADITSTTFTNEYNWGDFRGNPRKMMERWFDLHLYYANWGTRQLMIRIPRRLVDRARLEGFVREVDEVEMHETAEDLVVDISFDSEESGYDYDYDYGANGNWLDQLAPLRYDICAGDVRSFYILWLTAVERRHLPDHVEEPLPGIGPLTPPLEALAEFFGVDMDLVRAAGESPPGTESGVSFADSSRKFIKSIPETEKTALLLRVVDGDPHVAAELKSRIRGAQAGAALGSGTKLRTAGEIRERSLAVREERRAEQARRRERARLRKQREAKRARKARLESIKRTGVDQVWGEVEREVGFGHGAAYDRAVVVLADLQALAEEGGTLDAFRARVHSLRRLHARKWSFIEKLNSHRIGMPN